MHRKLLGTFLLSALASPLAAQTPNANCAAASTATADACEMATDLYNYMMPQLGTSMVGGSHTLGIGTSLGGFPHFAIALRGTAIRGDLPNVSGVTVSHLGRSSEQVSTSSQILGLPGVDFSLGLFKGLPLGVTRVGGVDLIGSVTYVPEIESTDDGVGLSPDGGSTKIGIGARVGLLEQSLIVPGISFSYLVRDLPTMNLSASANNASFAITDFSVKTKSWRLAAQKNLLLFQLGAGIGQDTYTSSARVDIDVTTPVVANMTTNVAQDLKRTTMYGSLGFNLLIAKIVAEVGQVSGGEVPGYNTFTEAADKSRLYGSVGIRISF